MQSQGNPSSAAPNPNQNAGVNPTPGLIPPFFPGLIPGMVPPPFPMPMMPGAPGLPAMQAPFPFVPGVPLPPGFPGIGMIPPFTGLPRPPLSGSTSISAPPITAVPVLTTPAAPAQVLVGNPVLRGPTSVASVVAQSSANNINLFNNINTNSCFINATSDLLNKHIFANAMAGLPLTIFVGHVPYDMEDSKLAKMFESCGKVTKFIRPVDPISTLPTTFAFITYAQAICALRAVNILNDFVVNKDDDWKIFVKLGSKEAPIIKSIKETEDEAAASLPPGFSLDDVYNPIKASIEAIVRPKEANEDGTIVDENIESGEIPSSSAPANGAESLEDTNGYYKYLNREAGEVSTEDDIGEKFLYSEIEKFRLRQLARDKKLEEQRRQKVKERLIALEAAKKQQAEDQAKQKESGAKESKPGDNAVGDVAQKRKSEVVDYEEMEAKKRRKLQVLQMLSGEVQEAVAVEEEKRPSGPIKVTAALTKKTTKPTGKAISAVATMDEEDEYEKKRELIRLDYTEEELKSFDDHARRRFDDEEEDDEGKGSAKSKAGASSTKDREEKTSSTSQPASTASQQQSKVLSNEVLKKIAEMIPTDKEELLSHVISWTVLETHDIVSKYLHEWVAKRTKEYLGEEVESLTSFIVAQLKSRCQPKELLDELSTILEDDSEAFVLKLWRMLVYYSLKCEMEDKA